jgi:hypothetical protein
MDFLKFAKAELFCSSSEEMAGGSVAVYWAVGDNQHG